EHSLEERSFSTAQKKEELSHLFTLANRIIQIKKIGSYSAYISSLINAIDLLIERTDISDNRIPLSGFLQSICEYTIEQTPISVAVTIEYDITDIVISRIQAFSAAVICIDTISGALKHAFPERLTGRIWISAEKHEDNISLVICDDGIGVPEAVLPQENKLPGTTVLEEICHNAECIVVRELGKAGTIVTARFTIQ
ncbi:MAG: hypothetical protein ACLFR1_16090, partial [Spirochaetia bacterium]